MHKATRKLFSAYRFSAFTVMNVILALLMLNALLSMMFFVKDHFTANPVSAKYGRSPVAAVYPGLSEGEIDALLRETWSRSYVYEPFIQFGERPYQGRYVNVNANGFREIKDQGAWPPEREKLNIFLFGGSTMFGYGVADHQTVASYLQAFLADASGRDVRVYNFGRGNYYSTQERILYENILADGVIPDVAVFVDGLNDFYYSSNEPLFTSRIREFFQSEKKDTDGLGFIADTSIGRAVRLLGGSLTKGAGNEPLDKRPAPDQSAYADAGLLDAVIHRYLRNKALIEAVSSSFAVTPVFVWQPIPTYHYDQSRHLFADGGYGKHLYSKYGYERMAQWRDEHQAGDNFLWLADMQMDSADPLYVDKVHYSAEFSKRIAAEISRLIVSRSLLAKDDNIALRANDDCLARSDAGGKC